MITYRKGNVVEALKNGDIDVLVHGVNCQGKMNSGIAKEIRAEFPEVFEDYEYRVNYEMQFRDENGDPHLEDMLGEVQYVRDVLPGRHIFNAFTQKSFGYDGNRFCSYDAIDRVFRIIATDGIEGRIGMPKIGAGLGGGDWKIIEAIINSAFGDREVFVYELD